MNNTNLTDQELENFKKIHNEVIPNRSKSFENKFYSSKNNNKNLDPIIKKSLEIFDNFGFNDIDKSVYSVEFHQRNCGFERKNKRENPFTWHQDDYGAVNYRVNTIIYYLRKDKTIINGNLKYRINGKEDKHIVKNGNILCFRGDLWHYPETSTGFGCRDIIVVFIKRNN